jgi:hypothetical protein
MTTERLDDALRAPTVTNSPAYRLYDALQRRVADELVRPHLIIQIVLGDDPVTVGQEVVEYLEDFGTEPGGLASPVQDIELCVQYTVIEDIDHDVRTPCDTSRPTWQKSGRG